MRWSRQTWEHVGATSYLAAEEGAPKARLALQMFIGALAIAKSLPSAGARELAKVATDLGMCPPTSRPQRGAAQLRGGASNPSRGGGSALVHAGLPPARWPWAAIFLLRRQH